MCDTGSVRASARQSVSQYRLLARWRAGALALSMLVSTPVLAAGDAATPATSSARRPAPATRVTTLDGRTIDLADLKGRVVIVDFWATWCPPCREEIPHFKALYAKHQPNLEILAVALDEGGPRVVAPFVKQQGIPYPVSDGHDQRLATAYGGIRGIPTTFVLDTQGRIYKKYVGYQAPEVFERDIATLLAE